MEINTTIDATEKCSIFEVAVTFSLPEIFKPIELEMQSEILDAVPDSEGMYFDFLLFIRLTIYH